MIQTCRTRSSSSAVVKRLRSTASWPWSQSINNTGKMWINILEITHLCLQTTPFTWNFPPNNLWTICSSSFAVRLQKWEKSLCQRPLSWAWNNNKTSLFPWIRHFKGLSDFYLANLTFSRSIRTSFLRIWDVKSQLRVQFWVKMTIFFYKCVFISHNFEISQNSEGKKRQNCEIKAHF